LELLSRSRSDTGESADGQGKLLFLVDPSETVCEQFEKTQSKDWKLFRNCFSG